MRSTAARKFLVFKRQYFTSAKSTFNSQHHRRRILIGLGSFAFTLPFVYYLVDLSKNRSSQEKLSPRNPALENYFPDVENIASKGGTPAVIKYYRRVLDALRKHGVPHYDPQFMMGYATLATIQTEDKQYIEAMRTVMLLNKDLAAVIHANKNNLHVRLWCTYLGAFILLRPYHTDKSFLEHLPKQLQLDYIRQSIAWCTESKNSFNLAKTELNFSSEKDFYQDLMGPGPSGLMKECGLMINANLEKFDPEDITTHIIEPLSKALIPIDHLSDQRQQFNFLIGKAWFTVAKSYGKRAYTSSKSSFQHLHDTANLMLGGSSEKESLSETVNDITTAIATSREDMERLIVCLDNARQFFETAIRMEIPSQSSISPVFKVAAMEGLMEIAAISSIGKNGDKEKKFYNIYAQGMLNYIDNILRHEKNKSNSTNAENAENVQKEYNQLVEALENTQKKYSHLKLEQKRGWF